jgi:hypothetical protein
MSTFVAVNLWRVFIAALILGAIALVPYASQAASLH